MLPGWSTKKVSYLCPCIAEKLAAMQEKAGFPLSIIETARDMERQEHYKKIGASKTLRSRHLLLPSGKCLAFDIAPSEYLEIKGWNPKGPLWKQLGALGEAEGLEWGGSWGWDSPHFELAACQCPRLPMKASR